MARPFQSAVTRCFFEINPALPLLQRGFVEAVGACLLLVATAGSSLAVAPHAKQEPLVVSLLVGLSISGALVGLIVALGKISGGHFNPLITVSQWLAGERSTLCTIAYVAGQVTGGICGVLIANAVGVAAVPSTVENVPSVPLLVSEVVASAGLMTVVFGCARSSRWETGPFAVGGWLLAAIIATPSASYANPAVALAAIFAKGPVALSSATGFQYVAAQIVGMILAIAVNRLAFAGLRDRQEANAEESQHEVSR
ncbi:aquaporin [Rhizobium sp. WYJ-E13]|uniref:aquaporin n=1 Tax=Rhizobium sp. WYJ-E13 TaxID=2849093 RepID=UPI001C1E9C4F|nr:aquaporin [Rhizobium sp. WYJ-E13]QWW72285.1 aquaporin [Rhizobium sp. WYJ-E13]